MTKDTKSEKPVKTTKSKTDNKQIDKVIAKIAVEIFFITFATYGLFTVFKKETDQFKDSITAFIMVLLIYIKVS